MHVSPYLVFDGQCAEAFRFYQQVLGGEIETMYTYAHSPNPSDVPERLRDRILHARLIVGDTVIMGSDAPPDRYEPPMGTHVHVGVLDPEEAERIFHALAEGGTVTMPMEHTFWSLRFGMLVDRYGIPWMVNCEQSD